MANVEIKDITTTKSSFDGTELVEGQVAIGGVNSSFKASLADISDYVHKYKTGWVDYNDLATATVPLVHSGSGGYIDLPNDAAGAFTNKAYMPMGVSDIWDAANGRFYFTDLALGDMVDIRLDIQVTTTTSNQDVFVAFSLGIGGSEYSLPFHYLSPKLAGTYSIVRYGGFYMGDSNTLDNYGNFSVDTDSAATIKVNGWYCKITRR